MTKAEWSALDQKLRFRAFTMAKLGTATEIETAKQILADAVEKGETYAESWQTLKDSLGGNPSFKPGYWETVFRTNTQSAYMAGKLAKYADTGAVAYQLLVIEDERTSKICRHLLVESGYGAILPVGHRFWQKYGFPPYHFNCRTSVNPIYSSQVAKTGYIVEDVPMNRFAKFKPQKGFGGNPLDNGNWWMMTPSQMEQAIKYGCLNMFNREENIFADYDSVWKGYTRHAGKNGGWYDLCENPPDDWERGEHPGKPIVDFLVENGYKIKVLPDIQNIPEKYHIKWSNPDILINGFLADIKTVESSIVSRLKSVKSQGLRNVVLFIPERFSESEIQTVFTNWRHGRLNVLYIYKGKFYKRKLT